MMDWHDLKIALTIFGAVLLSAALSKAKTWTAKLTAIGLGVFFAVVFSNPVMHWLSLDVQTYEQAVTGLLALSGDRIARRLFDLVENGQVPWFK